MNRTGSLNNKEQMQEMTAKSIEARKDGKAAMKQAVTNATKASFWETNAKTKYQNKRLKEPVYNYLIEQIFGNNGKWVKDYIDSQLKEAKRDPNSKAADRIAGGLFNDHLWNELDLYLQQANKEDVDYTRYLIRQTLYDKQQEVFDNDIDDTILIINSRRSGKTECMGRIIAKGLLRKDAHVVYINRSSSAAIRQIRKPLETALAATNGRLSIVKGSVESQEVYFNNGSQLLVIGNNNASDTDKMRGERISLCIMDECAHQRYTRTLIREVIKPAMMDYENSQLIMVGTPPRIPKTYVEELWNNPKIKKYHWTYLDNLFIPNRENVIKEVCEEYGVDESSAFIQREYFGRMDAYDTEAQVFYGYKHVNKVEGFNPSHMYIGVDWGYEDKAAIVALIADRKTKRGFVVENWSESKKSITEICQKVVEIRDKLAKQFPNIPIQIICDTNEKGAVYELYQTYKLPNVYCAYKYDKDMAIELLAEWLRAGTIITQDTCIALIEDFDSTMFERDEETDKLTHTIDDDLYHPNSAFALLYASRQFDFDILGTNYSKSAKEIIDEELD